uniref:Uncharacterized protein n=1 Tax=Anguilla anguilla TaxID=7936 RepID=A0A0E9WBS1_ANGAN
MEPAHLRPLMRWISHNSTARDNDARVFMSVQGRAAGLRRRKGIYKTLLGCLEAYWDLFIW